MNMRKIQALKTKDKIYNSALELIRENGFENVLIKDITEHAGIAKGSFYSHFTSKENLLLYTYIRTNEMYTEAYEKVKHMEDFFDLMNTFMRYSYIEIEKLGNEIIRAMCVNLQSKDSRDAFFNEERGLYTSLTKIIEQGKENGYLNAEKPTEFFVDKIITLMIGMENKWCLLGRDSGMPEFAEESINTLLVGLAHI